MNENEFARAVGRYLENDLSPDEERALLSAIEADPDLRAAFAAQVRLSVRLDADYHAPRDPRVVDRTKTLLASQTQGQRTLGELQRRIGRRARARQWIGWAAAAALFLVAASLVVLLRPVAPTPPSEVVDRPEPPPPPVPPEPRPEPPPVVPPPEPRPPVEPPKEQPAPVVPPENRDSQPPPETPPVRPRPPVETKVAAARIESVSGEGFRTGPGGRRALRADDDLLPGEGVQSAGSAVIVFADQTRVEVASGTVVREIHDRGGKRFHLDRGTVRAQVVRQPEGQPLEVTTPHGAARVAGTTLRLKVDASTRLDVSEGRVQFTRDGKTVDVAAGEYSVAGPGVDLVAYARPQVIDLDDFGTGAACKPADGPAKKIYRDESLGATGGTCIAAPGVGTVLEGLLSVKPGAWHLWIRYRDTDLGPVGFQVLVDGRLAGTVVGEGTIKRSFEKWNWRRVSFEAKGKSPRLTIRSTSEATGYDRNDHTWTVVNRWDSIVLTRDPAFDPEKDLR